MVLSSHSHPGWPAVLADGPVLLRPYRRRDAAQWSAVRLANEEWLARWEPSVPGPWAEMNSRPAFGPFYRELAKSARDGTAMAFAILLREQGVDRGAEPPARGTGPHPRRGARERYVGHISLGNITRRAFGSAYAGYWVDSAVAGRGIMPTALALVVDHAFGPGGLHRVEVNVRPENHASRRVAEKLGFREEAYHPRYMYIDRGWRDHIGYALTVEDVAGEGGLLARWHRSSARRTGLPERSS